MMKLARWNPAREMLAWQRAFDRFFEDPFFSDLAVMPTWELALDVAERDDDYVVKASIPGVNPDDIEVTLENNMLTIKGEVKMDETLEEADYHLRERRYGSFSRSVRLPVAVNADAVSASYEHGVLTLTIPKADEFKPKRIAIRTNGKSSKGEIIDA